MIDIHCHLLPGIDDGAADLAAALDLARLAVADGITHLVCTPHIQPRRFDNTAERIAGARDVFEEALRAAGIPIQIACAAEVHFGLEIMSGVFDGTIPFLGTWQGKRVLLLELPLHEVPFGAERLTAWLLARDILPMLAHPERNRGFQMAPEKLRPFLAQGCLLQVTAGALAGQFGQPARALARELLIQEQITVLATDAHNLAHRPPALAPAVALAADLTGEAAAWHLVRDNPWRIVQDQFS